jgi:hypothetical protein
VADGVEMIQEYAISSWEQRIPAIIDPDCEKAVETANQTSGIRVATSSSLRKGIVGIGGCDPRQLWPNTKRAACHVRGHSGIKIRTEPIRGRAQGNSHSSSWTAAVPRGKGDYNIY